MHHLDPIKQFAIETIFKIKFFGNVFRVTNFEISMIAVCLIGILLGAVLRSNQRLVPSYLQAAMEMTIGAMYKTFANNLQPEVKKYHSFVFSLFLFILFANLLGLIPYSFASTSHISMTFTISIIVFILSVVISIGKHGIGFFKIFVPSGAPMWLVPLLFVLEFVSFLTRPVSLSIRLAANMIAGHVMLDVIAFFVIMMKFAGILPMLVLNIMMIFEFGVAILQAYIFSSFACVYINQAVAEH